MASVVSRNLFDLLGDEDSETVAREVEPATKEQPVVVQKKVDRSRASPKEARIRHEYPQRGGHKTSASNRNNEDTRSGAPRDRNVGPRLSGRREEGGGGGGGGDYHPTRTSRGARPNDRGRGGRGRQRGREYDRHSGTGRHDSEKKEIQGWGKAESSWDNNGATESSNWNAETKNDASWGDNNNDANAGNWGETKTAEENNEWSAGTVAVPENNEASNDAWKPTENTGDDSWNQQPESTNTWNGGDEGAKDENAAANGSTPAPEPEENHKTLDEYLTERAQKSLDISLPEVRKPNEGVDDSQWKDAVPLEKDEDEDFLFTGKEQSYRLKNKKAKSKTFVEITQTFEKPGGGSTRGRGRGRGGRGGGRGGDRDRDGGRDRNNYRDNNYDDNRDNRRRGGGGGGGGRSVVNLDDQSAFPSLGTS